MQEQILECLECWVELGLLSSESPHPLVSCSDHRWLCCSVRMCQLEISRPGSSWRCRRGNSKSSEVQIWSRGHQTGARMWLKTNQRLLFCVNQSEISIVLCQPIRDKYCYHGQSEAGIYLIVEHWMLWQPLTRLMWDCDQWQCSGMTRAESCVCSRECVR